MTQSELFQQLASAGLFPIPVDEGIGKRDSRGMRFVGDTAGFVEAAKALGSRCVFVASRTLVEADFMYSGRDDRFDDPPIAGESGAVDLLTTHPQMVDFKSHLGQHCGHRVWVGVDHTALEHLILSPWWDRLTELREQAIATVLQERDAVSARHEQDEQHKRDALLDRLRGLITDPQFVKLPTQMAMQAYAVEQLPELVSLGDRPLRAEIQALDAKIKARGLRGKK